MKFKSGDIVTYKAREYVVLTVVKIKIRDAWVDGYAYTSIGAGEERRLYVRSADDADMKFRPYEPRGAK